MNKDKKVYILLEEWGDHTCDNGSSIIEAYNNMSDAKKHLEELFNENIKIFKEKFGEYNFEIEKKTETFFSLQHDEFEDYIQIKIVEKMLK